MAGLAKSGPRESRLSCNERFHKQLLYRFMTGQVKFFVGDYVGRFVPRRQWLKFPKLTRNAAAARAH